ncbi:MAG: type II toxin-antitoxin system HicA family toxin [Dehalococcoidia bacterium]|nr:type II toxin-antitoxin system HicA family toxin [Dehalococcoidia bacterium]
MPKLPVISGDECIKALERLGYYVARTKGDHVLLGHSHRVFHTNCSCFLQRRPFLL